MTADRPSLRQRQADHVRVAILDAVIEELERRTVDGVSMAEIAAAAGISLRTLYRYFPDRTALLSAAGEHLYGRLGVTIDISGPDDLAANFREAAHRLSARPALTRALVQTTAGRSARSSVRAERVAAIRTALKPVMDVVDPETAERATAVIAHLCSAVSWVSIADDTGLDDDAAQAAVAWAIDALLTVLRSEQPPRTGTSEIDQEGGDPT